jgi:tRNA threonylcarbamoyladenosine biosynthesis protein TsaB
MRILAMDTSAGACSAAVWDDGHITQRLVELERGHAERLIPLVLATLADAGVRFDRIDLLAVTVGPGAFTGLRVGLAAARGMALAAGLPCMGVTTLEAIASAVDPREAAGRLLLVTLDTKRGPVYAQTFAAGQPAGALTAVDPPGLVEQVGLRPVLLAGDAAAMIMPVLAEAGVDASAAAVPGYPTAACVAALAARRWQRHGGAGGESMPLPVYLSPPATSSPASSPPGRSPR